MMKNNTKTKEQLLIEINKLNNTITELERIRSIIKNSSDHVMLIGKDMKIQFINKTVPDLRIENIIGKSVYDFIPKDFEKLAYEKFQSVFKTGKPTNYQTEYLTAEGETHYFDVRLSPINKDGKVVSVVSSSNNITERRQAEEELQEANSLLSSILESPDNIIMFALDKNYNYLSFNKAHVKEMKYIYDVDIEIGQNILEYIPNEEDRLKAEKNYKRVLKNERFVEIQEYGESNNRSWYELIFNPIVDISNHVTGFTVFVTNVTPRKKVEEELAKHREHLEELVKDRTKELEEKNVELDQAMKVFVGRELTIRNLQKRIRALKGKD